MVDLLLFLIANIMNFSLATLSFILPSQREWNHFDFFSRFFLMKDRYNYPGFVLLFRKKKNIDHHNLVLDSTMQTRGIGRTKKVTKDLPETPLGTKRSSRVNSRKPNGQGVTLNKPAKSTKKSAPKPIPVLYLRNWSWGGLDAMCLHISMHPTYFKSAACINYTCDSWYGVSIVSHPDTPSK